MRILAVLSRIPFPLNDGGALLSYNTLVQLHNAGHELHILSLNTKKHYQSPDVLQDIACSVQTVDVDTDIHVLDALQSLLMRRSYIASRFDHHECGMLLNAMLSSHRFDIVHLDHTLMSWYAAVVAAYRRSASCILPKVVLRTHNVEYIIQERLAERETIMLKRWYRRYEASLLREFEQRAMEYCDGVIAITSRDAERIRRLGYAKPLAVVPAGVNTTLYTIQNAVLSDSPLHSVQLCYIGGMDWIPNVEAMRYFVEKVMPCVRQALPNCTLHIAGKHMNDEILHFARKYPDVFAYEDVPSAKEFLQARDILVVPLLSGGGMRLKIIEAMALGVPVISTRVGVEGIAACDGEHVVLAETPEEFVRAIQQLCFDASMRRRIVQAARTLVEEQYTWEAVVRRQLDFYEQLITGAISQELYE
ncbi:MAG: glycosyltransferase family 4 protein [Bacteroidota bacterium]|nr:glycosyltransferase family 4 protein [Candidatus Kapabacteria bacterium]MDW8219253.1 glycosyltransferase family 4 protein [Bacteroidota bacterium]